MAIYDTNTYLVKALRKSSVTSSLSEQLYYDVELLRKRYETRKSNFSYWHKNAMKKHPNPRDMWKDCSIIKTAQQDFRE
ncbi:MAG: hypothetical protein KGN33_15435 [Paracoccaceae bacterium]|nr:hypothetical protein [Paracoccaceae bacterium]